jgi:hypothetical protein
MPLWGEAAVAMWWNMQADHRREFEDWHTHEHFPERLGIPGFLRATRWASVTEDEGFFVMYELDRYETLSSPAYLARLNAPTPWSVQMMPRHANMVRSQCRVLESHGAGIAGWMLTIRLSPAPGQDEALRLGLRQRLQALPSRPGLGAAHLLRTQTPPIDPTTEQKIRGSADRVADWVLLVNGYDVQTLRDVAAGELGTDALVAMGAAHDAIVGVHRLACTMTGQDL